MKISNRKYLVNFIRELRMLELSPHYHEGGEYYVRDGKEVRKVEGKVSLYGVSEGGPFDQVEKQVVFAISPLATKRDIIIALRSLTEYFERLPESLQPPVGHIVTSAKSLR